MFSISYSSSSSLPNKYLNNNPIAVYIAPSIIIPAIDFRYTERCSAVILAPVFLLAFACSIYSIIFDKLCDGWIVNIIICLINELSLLNNEERCNVLNPCVSRMILSNNSVALAMSLLHCILQAVQIVLITKLSVNVIPAPNTPATFLMLSFNVWAPTIFFSIIRYCAV